MTNDPQDRISFEIRHREVAYRARLADPQFALTNGSRTLHFLFARLKPFGLNVSDLKLEGNLANPPSVLFSASLPRFNASIRLRLDLVELEAFGSPANAPLTDIAAAALMAVGDVVGTNYSGVTMHEATLGVHGVLGMPVGDFLKRFVQATPAGSSPSGVGFDLGAEASKGRLSSFAIVTASVIVTDALYVQINTAYGGALSVADVRQDVQATALSTLERLNLVLSEVANV